MHEAPRRQAARRLELRACRRKVEQTRFDARSDSHRDDPVIGNRLTSRLSPPLGLEPKIKDYSATHCRRPKSNRMIDVLPVSP